MTSTFGYRAAGRLTEARGSNELDGGAPYYAVYETADGGYISIGALEDRFYREFLRLIGLDPKTLPDRTDRSTWPALRERFAATFKTKTRGEWVSTLEGSDACFAPVLSMGEALAHPQNTGRGSFMEIDGVVQPGPTPRFSRNQARLERGPARPGEHTREALRDWGFDGEELDALMRVAAIA